MGGRTRAKGTPALEKSASHHPAGLGAMTHCPSCRGELVAVRDQGTTNFLCEDCGRCWHVEMGFVHRVDPNTCLECPRRPGCLARWNAAA